MVSAAATASWSSLTPTIFATPPSMPSNAVDDGRRELDGVRLACDVRAVGIAHEPVRSVVDPDGEARGLEDLDRPRHERGRDRVLLDDVHLRLDDEAAVEAGQRRTQREWLDEHLHPPRRPPARQGEVDTRLVQLVCGLDGARRQLLLSA